MKKKEKKYVVICITMLFLAGGFLHAEVGFYVSNGKLYDGNNNEFVMRGVSHAHTWYSGFSEDAIRDISSVGANAIRIVLSSGDHIENWGRDSAATVAELINICKNNQVIALLECHDTTGYREKNGAVSLATAVQYWRDIKSVLDGQENYVLINIGNEPYGNVNYENWVEETRSAIQSMRNAGFDHTLVVDAPNWGQDWSFTMRDNAQYVYSADSTGNTILSIHMYGVYKNDNIVKNYISSIKAMGLPLIIGEFGHYHSDGDPDEAAIMYRSVEYNVGYFGWSWCGNSGGVEYLDMVNNWNVNSLTDWGNTIVYGPNGLQSMAGICSIYVGGSVTPPAEPDPTPPPPSAGSCANVPVWDPVTIYNQNNTRVRYNDLVYENKWYSQGQNPEENSSENQVWTFIGICEEAIGATPVPTTPPTNPPTPVPTAPPTNPPTPVPTNTQTQPPVGTTGDVDSNGEINIIDALLVAQFYVDLNPQNFNREVADVNCDGTINIIDALRIAQYYVDLITGFDC